MLLNGTGSSRQEDVQDGQVGSTNAKNRCNCGQSMNHGALKTRCYLEVLKRLRESVRRKRPELWPYNWILHHDNARAIALRICKFLAKISITEMDYHLVHLT
jgi:hypothetical protein